MSKGKEGGKFWEIILEVPLVVELSNDVVVNAEDGDEDYVGGDHGGNGGDG